MQAGTMNYDFDQSRREQYHDHTIDVRIVESDPREINRRNIEEIIIAELK
jgi:hypothetical protein